MPQAMSPVMVSPIARPIPNMMEATMLDRAEGMVTRTTVYQPLAPKAKEALLHSWGTATRASSERLIIEANSFTPRSF